MQRQHLLVVQFTHSLCVTRFANGSVATNLTPHIAIRDRHQLDIARTEYWWRKKSAMYVFAESPPDMEKENFE